MRLLADPVVDWAALLDVLWTSLLAGIGVTAAFAFAILSATRAFELRRDGHASSAGLYAVAMTVSLIVVVGALVFGIVIMVDE